MTQGDLRRRRLLQAAGTTLFLTTAGCLGFGSSDGETSDPATNQSGTETSDSADVPTDTTTETPTAKTVARSVIENLIAGDYEAARSSFASSLAEQFPTQGLKERWKKQRWFIDGAEQVQKVSVRATETTQSEATTTEGVETVVVHIKGGHGRLAATVDVRSGAVTGLSFSLEQNESYSLPKYAQTDNYTERSVTIDADTGYPLPGTVTLPTDRDGPAPGLVLVHGSGPQDRNSTVGPQKPFKDLAVGLASRGVAVLRYRKRTREYNVDDVTKLTPEWITVEDARAAVETLANETRVQTDGVGVFGHSLGGYLGPMIADRSDTVAALVLANAPGRALWRTNLHQLQQIYAWDGTITQGEQSRLNRVERVGEQVSANGFPADRKVFSQYGAFWNAVTDYDQTSVAAELSVPVAVRQGDKDIQVPPGPSTTAWRNGLKDSTDAVKRYGGLNHLLLPTDGPSYLGRYYTESRNVAQPLIEDITRWLTSVTNQ